LSKGLAEANDDEGVAAAVIKARAVSKFKKAGSAAGADRKKIEDVLPAEIYKLKSGIEQSREEAALDKEFQEATEQGNRVKIDQTLAKVKAKAAEMKKKAEAKMNTLKKAAGSGASSDIETILEQVRLKYSNWSTKSQVRSFSNQWKIQLKEASEQVGTALNEVKSDEEVEKILAQAKTKSGEIEQAITANMATFKAELDAGTANKDKKAEFEAAMKAAGDEITSKVTGVKIFADIAGLKVAANKKTREIKDKMSKAVVEAKGDAQVAEAMKVFEREAKQIAVNLETGIATETAKAQNLQKPE